MDIVLGVSMAPSTVCMVLVEGENADGVTVEEDDFDVTATDGSATFSAADRVIAAILGTQEGAAEGGYRLTSTGVTWTEPAEAGGLRDALAGRGIGNVMLVSPLLAAAALTQTVGHALDHNHTALLFVEPESATLAVVDSADGSIVDLHRQAVPGTDADWAKMVAGLDELESRPDGVFMVGCGVDIVPIKPQLEAATSLAVSAPEEPDMALARGAALASANAPLFASSTAALAYAQDPGTGEVDPYALAPTYLDVSANARLGDGALAYSAVGDGEDAEPLRRRRPFALVGSAAAAAFAIGVVVLVVSLSTDVGPSAGQRPSPGGNIVVPTKQAPAPPPQAHAPTPAAPPAPSTQPAAPPPAASPATPAPQTAPAPVVQQPPRQAPTVAPTQRAPTYVPPTTQQAPATEPSAEPSPAAEPSAAPSPAPAAPSPAPAPAAPQVPPMTMYLHLPFVTVPIPINPPQPAP